MVSTLGRREKIDFVDDNDNTMATWRISLSIFIHFNLIHPTTFKNWILTKESSFDEIIKEVLHVSDVILLEETEFIRNPGFNFRTEKRIKAL